MNAIILASGFSRRMGSNKLLAKLNNINLIEHLISEIVKFPFKDILVVYRSEEVKNILTDKYTTLNFVKNNNAHFGKSESIKVAIKNINNLDNYMFFVADQPFITYEIIKKIIDTSLKYQEQIILPYVNGQAFNPVVFPSHYKNSLLSLSGDDGGKIIIKNNKNNIIKVKFEDANVFKDIDTLKDLYEIGGNLNE